jgi:hypothetical protein
MSGSKSSGLEAANAAESLHLTVHAMPGAAVQQTRRGRFKMLLVLLVCSAPVLASYFTYYVVRPEGRTNYSTLIKPQRPIPTDLALTDLQGRPVASATLKGQWLLVVVASGACDAPCEKMLYLQRQLRESLGREKERVDKVWLIPDTATPNAALLSAIHPSAAPTTILRTAGPALAAWLQPESEQNLGAHFYIIDPMGDWMMRSPAAAEPAKLKRDIEKLLRASSSWDQAGRPP